MEEPRSRSWGARATDVDVAAGRRRERRRRWLRPQSVLVAVGVIAVDLATIVGASVVTGASRARKQQACDTLFADLAHDQTVGLWILGILIVVTVLVAARWRWVLVATLVVQLVVAALLVPPILDKRADFTAVAEGRRSPIYVDTGGAACS